MLYDAESRSCLRPLLSQHSPEVILQSRKRCWIFTPSTPSLIAEAPFGKTSFDRIITGESEHLGGIQYADTPAMAGCLLRPRGWIRPDRVRLLTSTTENSGGRRLAIRPVSVRRTGFRRNPFRRGATPLPQAMYGEKRVPVETGISPPGFKGLQPKFRYVYFRHLALAGGGRDLFRHFFSTCRIHFNRSFANWRR